MAADKQIDALLNYAMAAMLEARRTRERDRHGRYSADGIMASGKKRQRRRWALELAIGGFALAIMIGTGGAGVIANLAAGGSPHPSFQTSALPNSQAAAIAM